MFAIIKIADDRAADGLSGRGAERLRDARDHEACDVCREDGGGAGEARERQARQHDRPSAEAVGQRSEHELRRRQAHEIERDRELYAGGIGGELRRQPRERRHQDIQRERAHARHRDQQGEQPPRRAARLAPCFSRRIEQRDCPGTSGSPERAGGDREPSAAVGVEKR